jgi:hypothetical protein
MQCRYCEQKKSHARTLRAVRQFPAHTEFRRERRKRGFEAFEVEGLVFAIRIQAPLHAHEKQPLAVVLMLIGMKDVRSVLVKQAGNTRHQPPAVGTINQ